jgi:hypothetical protein
MSEREMAKWRKIVVITCVCVVNSWEVEIKGKHNKIQIMNK